MFDPSRRTVRDLKKEIDLFLSTPGITLPGFISLTISLVGTPYLEECVRGNLLLPKVKLRDLDGFTSTLKPLDPATEVASFIRDLLTFMGFRGRVIRKAWDIVKTHRGTFGSFQLLMVMVNVFNLCAPHPVNSPGRFPRLSKTRTYISTTEPLDPMYSPLFRVRSGYRNHFQPTLVTDSQGQLAEELLQDCRPDGSRSKNEEHQHSLVSGINFF